MERYEDYYDGLEEDVAAVKKCEQRAQELVASLSQDRVPEEMRATVAEKLSNGVKSAALETVLATQAAVRKEKMRGGAMGY